MDRRRSHGSRPGRGSGLRAVPFAALGPLLLLGALAAPFAALGAAERGTIGYGIVAEREGRRTFAFVRAEIIGPAGATCADFAFLVKDAPAGGKTVVVNPICEANPTAAGKPAVMRVISATDAGDDRAVTDRCKDRATVRDRFEFECEVDAPPGFEDTGARMGESTRQPDGCRRAWLGSGPDDGIAEAGHRPRVDTA